MGEDLDSRLKMSGMTEEGLKAWGMTECLLCLFVMPASPLCHARRALSVIPAGCQRESRVLLCCSFIRVGPAWRKPWIPD